MDLAVAAVVYIVLHCTVQAAGGGLEGVGAPRLGRIEVGVCIEPEASEVRNRDRGPDAPCTHDKDNGVEEDSAVDWSKVYGL